MKLSEQVRDAINTTGRCAFYGQISKTNIERLWLYVYRLQRRYGGVCWRNYYENQHGVLMCEVRWECGNQ